MIRANIMKDSPYLLHGDPASDLRQQAPGVDHLPAYVVAHPGQRGQHRRHRLAVLCSQQPGHIL